MGVQLALCPGAGAEEASRYDPCASQTKTPRDPGQAPMHHWSSRSYAYAMAVSGKTLFSARIKSIVCSILNRLASRKLKFFPPGRGTSYRQPPSIFSVVAASVQRTRRKHGQLLNLTFHTYI